MITKANKYKNSIEYLCETYPNETKIIQMLASLLNVTYEELISPKRNEFLTIRRKYIIQYISTYNPFNTTSTQLGILLNRDHTTILHAIKTLRDFLQIDKIISYEYYEFCQSASRVLKDFDAYLKLGQIVAQQQKEYEKEKSLRDANDKLSEFLNDLAKIYKPFLSLKRLASQEQSLFIKEIRFFFMEFLLKNDYKKYTFAYICTFFNRSEIAVIKFVGRYRGNMKYNVEMQEKYSKFYDFAIRFLKSHYKGELPNGKN